MAKLIRTANPLLPLLAGICAWLFPGAGHLLIGEYKRALVISVSITALFVAGLYVGSVAVVDPVYEMLYYCTQILASPLVFVIDHMSGQMGQATPAKRLLVFARPNEIGQIYTSVAGMLNLLCVFSAILLADAQQRHKKGE
jgi:hypothetical protein